jgi:hypothetical protein
MSEVPLLDRVERLCAVASAAAVGEAEAMTIEALRERLHEPLRVAIVGRAKAGKSTLLNVLVGERLAATDAGECTRVVTWYRSGTSYEVRARLRNGEQRAVRFRRDHRLQVLLDDLEASDIDRLEIRWPAERLARLVLVDTPGLASSDSPSAARTLHLAGADEDRASEVDAIVYLLRHAHQNDVDFLEAFLDPQIGEVSPANTIAVLSRADEIGAGRLDALASAQSVAARYANDLRIRRLCSAVVPIAGLIAETGLTLREDEAASLRALAALPPEDLDGLLLSTDHFVDPARSSLPATRRADLLERLGLFGLRWSIDQIRVGGVVTASDLSRALTEASGIRGLTALLDGQLVDHSRVLKARAALATLMTIAQSFRATRGEVAQALLDGIEEIEASSGEFAQLRAWSLIQSGTVQFDHDEQVELERLTAGGDPASQLGLATDRPLGELLQETATRAARWRARLEHPLTDPQTADACGTMVWAYEKLHARLLSRGAEMAPASSEQPHHQP